METPGIQASRIVDTTALYQRFPHLQAIESEWGTRACRRRLMNLLTDSRGGTRQGFPPEHARTIFGLLAEHDRLYPAFENDLQGQAWTEYSPR